MVATTRPPEDDSESHVQEDLPLPSMDDIEEMDRNRLRALAAEWGVSASKRRTKEQLVHDFSRIHDGGRILRCPNDECKRRWVWQGDPRNRITTCPRCRSSVAVKHNTIRVIDPDE